MRAHRSERGLVDVRVLARTPRRSDRSSVIGRHDDLKGQMPMGFVILKNSADANPEQIVQELIGMVRQEIGAVAAFKEALVVARLPKTRSGKILRKTLRCIVDGEPYTVPSTIDDPASLDEIKAQLEK